MTKRAIIAGGSIGGLFAATALLRAGWHVDVYERTDVELSGRGAGIVTHDTLIAALETVGADLTDLGVQVHDRVAFDKAGSRIATLPYSQIVTSWDRIHQLLRKLIPRGCYHLGRHVKRYNQNSGSVTAQFDDGTSETADLLVGADGFRSAIRAQMLPDITPQYAGYVVWRALVHEADLPANVHADVFDAFTFYTPSGSQIIGYPIAGPNNDLRLGHRRYNFVWYAPAADLDDMLTDDNGDRHKISIPPPLIRGDVLGAMQTQAKAMMPASFIEILNRSERPFFTPIYDHHSPVMHDGRVALSGDAACVARPHVGMGVTKAAEDALALARHANGPLAAYSDERVPASLRAHLRARQLGSWMQTIDATNSDGASHPQLSDIMRLTAVTVD
ncbi:FAD binding domain-containing protein [Octadecabacter sp.]|nr:FAD binding domain-containing protein [Octadecabacter sp.]MDC1297612.1 FAD binding domain-containing protein [Octadecabacter sp.]